MTEETRQDAMHDLRAIAAHAAHLTARLGRGDGMVGLHAVAALMRDLAGDVVRCLTPRLAQPAEVDLFLAALAGGGTTNLGARP